MAITGTNNGAKILLTELYAMWDKLGDVPTYIDSDGDQLLDEPFLHFGIGYPCEQIWHWFEAQNPNFIVGQVMEGTRMAEHGLMAA